MSIFQTAERVSSNDVSDNYVFQRSLLALIYLRKSLMIGRKNTLE